MTSHDGHDMASQESHNMSSHAGHNMSSHFQDDMPTNPADDFEGLHRMGDGGMQNHSMGAAGGHGDGLLQAGVKEILLFPGATTYSTGTLIVACFVMVALAFSLEYLRLLAWYLESRYLNCSGSRRVAAAPVSACPKEDSGNAITSSPLALVVLSIVHAIVYVLGTCLMLIAMTFNIYLILSLALGASAGKVAAMFTKARITPNKA